MPWTGDILFPGMLGGNPNITGSVNSHTIGATTSQAEWVFAALEDATIVDLGFRYTSKGAGTPPLYTISLQTVSGGNPSGTVLASGTFTPPNDSSWNGTFRWIALSSSVNITRGTRYAIVISTSGTANSDQFTINGLSPGPTYNFPIGISNTTGTRSRQNGGAAIFGYRSTTRTYGYPLAGGVTLSYNTSTSPSDFGFSFNIPSSLWSTYQVSGVAGLISVSNTTGNAIFTLETTGGTVLQSVTVPKAEINGTSRRNTYIIFPGSPVTLNSGTEYYLFMRSDDTNNVGCGTADFAADADAAAMFGGSNFALVSRTGGGAVTKTTTRRIAMDLIISDITPPTGGGLLVGGGFVY